MGLSEQEKRAHARALNLARRHLNTAQKRDLIEAQLRDTPQVSNRQIAENLKVDHKTVGDVRLEIEAGGEFPQVPSVIGADGKAYPARRPYRFEDDRAAREQAVTRYTGEYEWNTPPEILDAARQVLGGFDLDPASNAVAQRTVRARRYYTQEDDGLAKHWKGRVWLNPPYATRLLASFIEKLVGHVEQGDVSAAIVLVENRTDTEWFHMAAKRAKRFCFTRGRVRFLRPDGGQPQAPTAAPCCFTSALTPGCSPPCSRRWVLS